MGTAVLGVCLGIAGKFLISPIFGVYFESSVTPLLILIPATVAFAPGSIISVYFSMRQGKTRYPLLISVISLTVTTVAAIILIPGHFVSGAAEACAAGYIVGMTVGLYWFAHESGVGIASLVPRPADIRALFAAVRGLAPR